jgi:hypothetical protein
MQPKAAKLLFVGSCVQDFLKKIKKEDPSVYDAFSAFRTSKNRIFRLFGGFFTLFNDLCKRKYTVRTLFFVHLTSSIVP